MSGTTELVRRNVRVSSTAPVISYISGTQYPTIGSPYYPYENHYMMQPVTTLDATVTSAEWELVYPDDYSSLWWSSATVPGSLECVAYFQDQCEGRYLLYGRVSNACGTDEYELELLPTSYSPVSAYPNPATSVLNIEIDLTLAKAPGQAKAASRQAPAYDIRLYDGQGNLLRQQKTGSGTVQFNVSNLTNGIYYLHVYDGVSAKPDMQQIVVEH
jgi:hypothetical protein